MKPVTTQPLIDPDLPPDGSAIDLNISSDEPVPGSNVVSDEHCKALIASGIPLLDPVWIPRIVEHLRFLQPNLYYGRLVRFIEDIYSTPYPQAPIGIKPTDTKSPDVPFIGARKKPPTNSIIDSCTSRWTRSQRQRATNLFMLISDNDDESNDTSLSTPADRRINSEEQDVGEVAQAAIDAHNLSVVAPFQRASHHERRSADLIAEVYVIPPAS